MILIQLHFHDIKFRTKLQFVRVVKETCVGASFPEKHLTKNCNHSIEILKTMREDEDLHAQQALDNGGEELKIPTKKIMSAKETI